MNQFIFSMVLQTLLVTAGTYAADESFLSLVQTGDPESVRKKLKESPNLCDSKDSRFGMCALGWAALCGKKENVAALIDAGANVSAKSREGETPLMWAAKEGHDNIIELLLSKHVDLNLKSDGGMTALCYAILNNHESTVELLLKSGAEVNVLVTNKQKSPLHLAVVWSTQKVVEQLIEKRADLNAKDAKGATPLDEALSEKNSKLVELLKKRGAKSGTNP